MRGKDFLPSQFLAVLEGEMSTREIARKLRCSETTAEKNLKLLIGEGKVARRMKLGTILYRRRTDYG